ncbi:MAG TPA: hypothetical protein DCO77_11940 [Nitrospiraceae bacterium]|nr:hypothetical protein [Nitrospiraceae bacterium]
METSETYIVRIYRRDENDPRHVAGMVEIAGGDERRTFSNYDELWEALAPEKKKQRKRTEKRVAQ